MTRRSAKQNNYRNSRVRSGRIAKLIAEGWIQEAIEIPQTAIPVDPHKLNLGGSWHRPTYYEDLEFVCRDCGIEQTWKAEDQARYYESSGAPYYSTAIRCRKCRIVEREKKAEARKSAGHDKQ
jgi:ribosomal protein L40E